MKTTPEQRSFASGEIDPLLHRRADYLRYQTGLAKCRGFLPLPQGGFTRAPGTIFQGYTSGNNRARLIPFVFAENDAVVLEFSANLMRVWRYGNLITGPGGTPFGLATPYDLDAVQRLRWVQSADVIYLADGRLPIQRLARTALDAWTITPQSFDRGPFRGQNTNRFTTVQASAMTGSVTLTASFPAFVTADVGSLMMLTPSDNSTIALWEGNRAITVGEKRRYGRAVYELVAGSNTGVTPPTHDNGVEMTDDRPTKWRWLHDDVGIVRITAVTSDTVATATVIQTIPQGCVDAPSYRWSRGAWSDRFGYPACLEIFDQRLVAAATPTEPRALWFSTVGAFDNFLPGTAADEAFGYAIAGDGTVNRIVNICRGRMGLHIFALGEEYASRSETRAQAIGPTTAVFEMIGSTGAASAKPIAPDGDPIYITRDGTRVVRLAYSLEADSARGTRLSLPAQHLGAAGFAEIVWQPMPSPMAWLRRATGDLVAMIHDPAEEVLGWAVVSLAGGVVESLCVSPDATGTESIVTMVVRRTVNGETRRMVERFSGTFGVLTGAEDITNACHLYAAKEIINESPTDKAACVHLKGQSVYVWSDAGQFGPLVVPEDGLVPLPVPISRGFVGLFDGSHRVETLPIQASAQTGSAAGQKLKIGGVTLGLHRTAQGKIAAVTRSVPAGKVETETRPIIPQSVADELTEAYSGLISCDVIAGGSKEVQIAISPDGGAPLTVLSITPTIKATGD